jgi:hypothetical protein
MLRPVHLCVLLIAALTSIVRAEDTTEKTQVIPLDRIWALNMPGTKAVGELDSVQEPSGVVRHPSIREISRMLSSRTASNEKAGTTFIVAGSDARALQNAQAVFTDTRERATDFPSKKDLSLVFYSRLSGRYIHLVSVEVVCHVFTINYRFVSHNTRDSTVHFAIIPIGQLPMGEYEVKIEQLPPVDEKGMLTSPVVDSERIVSQDFSFRIKE